MADGFLGRWSRRKLDVAAGKPVAEPPPPLPAAAAPLPTPASAPAAAPAPADAAPAAAPLPTLEDTASLTPASDFKPFMAQGVSPQVKNAAMKKLFADPHFNVMDGMDVYIDDYSRPDPLPAAMLRQMASAQFLKLVDEEPAPAPTGQAAPPGAADGAPPALREVADAGDAQSVAQSSAQPDIAPPNPSTPEAGALAGPAPQDTAPAEPQAHAHADLRLQPHHAPGRASAGGGPP